LEASNSENPPYLGPKHCFLFEKCCLKSDNFSGAALFKKVHQEVARSGMCPLLFGVFEGDGIPPHRQEYFEHVTGFK
jgi:hypothetical protein